MYYSIMAIVSVHVMAGIRSGIRVMFRRVK